MIAAIQVQIEQLAAHNHLDKLAADIKETHADVFKPIPHVSKMPDDIHCKITLKDADKTVSTCSSSCPQKYHEAWNTLISKHLDAGQICLSSLAHMSPAFLVPKADREILPGERPSILVTSSTVMPTHKVAVTATTGSWCPCIFGRHACRLANLL